MDRILEMEVFVAVNETGSFARASKRMHMSPPAITRSIASLEERLGISLLIRTTRRLSLTDAGERYLVSARRLLEDIDHAEKNAVGEIGIPQGHLNISTSVTFGRFVVTPLVRTFLAKHPRITASIISVDRVVNIIDEGIDVAVRIGTLPDSSLTAKRIGSIRRVFVASPNYLKQHGTPIKPADLKLHSMIGFTGAITNREWYYKTKHAKGHVTLSPRLEVNDATSAVNAAIEGEGITMAMSYVTSDAIRAKKLVPILEDYLSEEVPVHLVFPQSRLIAPKLRAFLDYSADRLKTTLAEF